MFISRLLNISGIIILMLWIAVFHPTDPPADMLYVPTVLWIISSLIVSCIDDSNN